MARVADALRDRYEHRIGTSLGKYKLEALLGIGGMAAVFRARHRNGNRVAVKLLHAELALDAEMRARFQREGYAANQVTHPGVVRVLDDDVTADGSVFLVMELLEGETLDARWSRCGRRLDVRDVCAIADQVLEVLDVAQRAAVVHRDIKPENLFVTRDGRMKILDFGIARLQERAGPAMATLTGRAFGTPAFMPPEQALGKKAQIDGQTDVWAVAATMFTLISGAFVHDAESAEEMVVFTATKPARPLTSVAPDTPPAIAAVVDRGLAFSKRDRWPSASAMRDALARAHDEVYGVAIPTTVGPAVSISAPPLGTAPRVAVDAPTLGETEVALAPTVRSGPEMISIAATTRTGRATTARSRSKAVVAIVAGVALTGGLAAGVVRYERAARTRTAPAGTAAGEAARPAADEAATIAPTTTAAALPSDAGPSESGVGDAGREVHAAPTPVRVRPRAKPRAPGAATSNGGGDDIFKPE